MWTVVIKTVLEYPISVRAENREDAVDKARVIFADKYPTKHSQRRKRAPRVLQVVDWDRKPIPVKVDA